MLLQCVFQDHTKSIQPNCKSAGLYAGAGVFEAGVQQLRSMGFERQAAVSALNAAKGDVPAAVEMLSS
jgi:hypothetical protein